MIDKITTQIDEQASTAVRDLVALNQCSHEIYHYGAEHIEMPGLQAELKRIANERETQAMALIRILSHFTADAQANSASQKSLHPCWSAVKDALGGGDAYQALDEIESGERCMEDAYLSVLALSLPASIHLMIESHVTAVMTSRQRMKDLRNAVKPRNWN